MRPRSARRSRPRASRATTSGFQGPSPRLPSARADVLQLWNTFHAPKDVEGALDDSLAKLGTAYVDLYLMHWPVAQRADGAVDAELTEDPCPTWRALETLVDSGKARNIGVSKCVPHCARADSA